MLMVLLHVLLCVVAGKEKRCRHSRNYLKTKTNEKIYRSKMCILKLKIVAKTYLKT